MLKKQMQQQLSEMISKEKSSDLITIGLYSKEIEYIQKHQLVEPTISLIAKTDSRFSDAYIERSNKETEEVIAEENAGFLDQPITYLKQNKNEFIYLESKWLELIGVDAVSLEVDDVFGTYDVMLGLKLQKKYEASIKAQLKKGLTDDETNFDLMFNHDDGLWGLNFALNELDGFSEEISIGDAYNLIYHFLFNVAEGVEEDNQ